MDAEIEDEVFRRAEEEDMLAALPEHERAAAREPMDARRRQYEERLNQRPMSTSPGIANSASLSTPVPKARWTLRIAKLFSRRTS